MIRLEDFKDHISRDGRREYDSVVNSGRSVYEVYTCDHCGNEFALRENYDRSILHKKVRSHIREEHPEVLERDEYPNEQVVREWADKVGGDFRDPGVPGEELTVAFGPMDRVILHPDGTIVVEAARHLGGYDSEVRREGNRLVVDGEGYVSDKTFPVFSHR